MGRKGKGTPRAQGGSLGTLAYLQFGAVTCARSRKTKDGQESLSVLSLLPTGREEPDAPLAGGAGLEPVCSTRLPHPSPLQPPTSPALELAWPASQVLSSGPQTIHPPSTCHPLTSIHPSIRPHPSPAAISVAPSKVISPSHLTWKPAHPPQHTPDFPTHNSQLNVP